MGVQLVISPVAILYHPICALVLRIHLSMQITKHPKLNTEHQFENIILAIGGVLAASQMYMRDQKVALQSLS